MSKIRKPIQPDLAAEVLYLSDNTCCVCKERGKSVQIHHIDEDPSHNVFENLACLCFECHNKTQIKGGFGRKLTSEVISKYRDEWLIDVKERRILANQRAVERLVGEVEISEEIESKPVPQPTEEPKVKRPPLAYINSLPLFQYLRQK